MNTRARPSFSQGVSAICLSLGVLAGASIAAQAPGPEDRLAHVVALDCTFSAKASGTWEGDAATAQTATSTLAIRFDAINADEGTAEAIGDFGPADIVVRVSQGTLHLLQMFQAGALYITTVFPKELSGGRLKAVHTRHEYTDVSLPGYTSRPEQYYGACQPE